MTPTRKRFLTFGAIGAACIAIAAAAFYIFDTPARPTAPPTASTSPRSPTPRTRPAQLPTPELATPTPAQSDKVVRLVGEARRLAAAGDFAGADAALTQADGVLPGLPETSRARAEIAQLRTPEGQLAMQLQRARLAVEHDDKETAEKALAEAERLDPQAPRIAELRQTLKAAQDKKQQRSNRIAELLTTMRDAIARRDLAAAGGALNEAERLDMQDPSISGARTELARAHEADRP